ncbi:MAG: hypothetical protein K8S87_00495 [Planctomycetes bacterium]|nr:hypothetical protein [Planctomycetota bacterium]
MKLLHENSLALTVNAVNDIFKFGEKVSASEKKKTAEFIASRQGLKYSYAGTFAPTTKDLREGALLYTGERIKTGAATMHILGEESIRALCKLGVKNKKVADALKIANTNMIQRLDESDSLGFY